MKLSAPIVRLKRQAKLLARETNAPRRQALDTIAQTEGYRSWSHLAGSRSDQRPAQKMLAQLVLGDLVLLGARPGHGKTLLGLELAVEAMREGRNSFFFSLEDNEPVVFERLRALGVDAKAEGNSLVVDTSDDISADYIIDRVRGGRGADVVVIDYLQALDHKRRNPELAVQVERLADLASSMPSIVVAISQIDRSFDLEGKRLPELSNVRLPNPVNLSLFTKTCFLHDGEALLEAVN